MGQNNDRKHGVLNSCNKGRRYDLPSLKLAIINESVDSFSAQDVIEMGSEVIAGVFSSKAQEHIIAPLERRRIRRSSSHYRAVERSELKYEI